MKYSVILAAALAAVSGMALAEDTAVGGYGTEGASVEGASDGAGCTSGGENGCGDPAVAGEDGGSGEFGGEAAAETGGESGSGEGGETGGGEGDGGEGGEGSGGESGGERSGGRG